MLNEVILVGRIASLPININKHLAKMFIDTREPYKNSQGTFSINHLPIYLCRGDAKTIYENGKLGSYLFLKGRLKQSSQEQLEIVADKVTILNNQDFNFSNE